MSLPENRRILVEVDANHPDLLTGLEDWLHLGLLSDRQIFKLGQRYLSDVVPEIVERPRDFIAPVEVVQAPSPRRAPEPPRSTFIGQILRSLQQELSVVWLLALGVFLVVISSAVLAASQWQNVSPTGQYLVLLSYTLTFWAVAFWTGRKENLRLTASTLQTLTLLLIPVNFWAIDRFLLRSIEPMSIVSAIASAGLLSGVAIALFRQRFSRFMSISIVGYLGLSILQCGWSFANFPLIAVYLGAVGAAIVVRSMGVIENSTIGLTLAQGYVAGLLILRAILIAEADIAQLGLAFGIVGWIVARIAQQQSWAVLWIVSGSLLGLGWLVSVGSVVWQALAVSGLVLLLWWKLLQRYERRFDVIGLLVVGLQSIWLVWRLVPSSVQTQIVNSATNLTQAPSIALLGIFLLPYLLGMMAIANKFDRDQKPELAKFTEEIALVFGLGLTALSLFAPATRALNLIASTAILRRSIQRKQNPTWLIYVTHGLGLAGLIAAIDWRFPTLDQSAWACIFLGSAIAEWGFSQLRNRTQWHQNAWYFGFALATLSYVFFFNLPFKWAIVWILIPAVLSAIAVRDESKRTVASGSSAIALLLVQLLAVQDRTTGLLSLGIATVLMLVNTRCLQRIDAVALTFGFGFGMIGWGIWHWLPGFAVESWLCVGAIVVALLWQFQRWGQSHRSNFVTLYARAADGWAIGLGAIVLFGLSLHTFEVYQATVQPNGVTIAAIGIIAGALVFRTWQTARSVTTIGIGIGLELLIAQSLAWFEPSLARLSVANMGLGLFILLMGEVWQRRTERRSQAWDVLPLVYGILALSLRSQMFANWTGWVSLGVAAIAITIGRRDSQLKPLTYLGIIGTSIAAYELLLYHVRILSLSDQLMSIATVGAVLMLLYRIPRSRLFRILNLSSEEIRPLAHLHWGVSSVVLSLAAISTLIDPAAPGKLALVGFTTGMILSLYAIWQARHRPPLAIVEIWLYAGLLEAAGLIWYLSTKPWFSGLFSAVVRPYAGTISAIVAFLMFVLPWDRFGWARQPWQRVALALPLLVLIGTSAIVHPVSLIVVAVFYALVASIRRQVRWTYLSIGLINWLVFDQLHQLNVEVLFWQVLPIGLSILYFAQVEPSFTQVSGREARHYVRICGVGLMGATALLTQENYGILPGIVGLIAIFAGLGLRVRAFLYVGTVVFLLNVINQLIVFIALYSLLKWIIGLCLGILLIWIAANFETRREQMNTLMQNWVTQLQQWE